MKKILARSISVLVICCLMIGVLSVGVAATEASYSIKKIHIENETATITVKNTTGAAKDAALVVTYYSEDGQFVSTSVTSVSITADSTCELQLAYTAPAAGSAKAILVNSTTDFTPLCGGEIVETDLTVEYGLETEPDVF